MFSWTARFGSYFSNETEIETEMRTNHEQDSSRTTRSLRITAKQIAAGKIKIFQQKSKYFKFISWSNIFRKGLEKYDVLQLNSISFGHKSLFGNNFGNDRL